MERKAMVKARMADVSGKAPTARTAVAEGWVRLSLEAWTLVRDGRLAKGDAGAVARVAGILAAKETPRMLPLCHPLPLASAAVEMELPEPGVVRFVATVRTVAPTGVEMEALCAVSVAALCLYDMTKPVDKNIVIDGIRLLTKTGGKSGDYIAPPRDTRSASEPAMRRSSKTSSARKASTPKRSRQ